MKSTSQSERLKQLSPAQRDLLLKMLQEQDAEQDADLQIIPRQAEGDLPPLSFAQQRLWFLDQLEPGGTAYNVPIAVRLEGTLAPTVLKRALNELIRRHEALRTTFMIVGLQPVQVIAPTLTLTLPTLDLQALAEAEREAEAHRFIAQETERPFELAHDPLLRITLLQLQDADHILVVVAHHIVSDAWSQAVFIHEISMLYQAFSTSRPSPLPELPIQYADFAAWQRTWLQGAELEKQLGYWRQQLDNSPPLLELPTDHPRPAIQTYRGAGQIWTLPGTLLEGLRALSRRERATLFMTMLAVFKVALYRYTGQTDIVIGTPIAGRTRTELEKLIGFFANTLVLRTNLSGNPTFQALLREVREVTLGAQGYQDLPFERLVEELQPERDISYHPLFQVMFVFQNVPMEVVEIPGLTLRSLDVERNTTLFDLTLIMMEHEQGLLGRLEYNTDLFDAATITRMIEHLRRLFEGVVVDSQRRLSELPLLSAIEQYQLLVAWNATQAEAPTQHGVHELFETQAEQTPDALAVVFEHGQLTYQTLNQQANHLARYLQQLGVGAESVVGVCLERTLALPLALLAIFKAGAAYLPLDPAHPHARLTFMLQEAQAAVLIRGQGSGIGGQDGRVPSPDPWPLTPDPWTVVDLRADWPQIARQPAHNLDSTSSAAHLAYVLFTSGSTGTPKAVAMSHHALLNLLDWQRRAFSHPHPARTLQFAAFTFDASFQEIFATWTTGGTLVLVPAPIRPDASALAAFLDAQQIARAFLPVVVLQHLAQALAAVPRLPTALREVITAGEALQITPAVTQLFTRLAAARLHNHYGPTETHVACAHPLPPAPAAWPLRPPIGRPISNATVHLLDAQQQPVAIGVVGEVYLGGALLARGYLHRPDLTAERFVPNPFVGGDKETRKQGDKETSSAAEDRLQSAICNLQSAIGSRLYRTGDLARYRPDGTLEFLGRIDGQLKLRGVRIELGEIEATLCQHAAVALAAVLARTDPAALSASPVLVAYVVPHQESRIRDQGSGYPVPDELIPNARPLIPDLRSFLKERLPDYMIPAAFVLRDALPLNRSGKIDRRALATADIQQTQAAPFVAPRTPLEARVAAIWATVLGRETISVTDDFFALGGHSLLATQMIARLRTSFQLDLAIRDLFREPTVAGLSASIAALQWAAQPAPPPVSADSTDREEIEL